MRASTLEHLILALMAQDSLTPKKNLSVPVSLIVTGLALIGLGFLMVAAYDWLKLAYDLQTARLYMGALSLGLALLVGASAMALHVYKLKKVRDYYHVVRDNVHAALTLVSDELEDPIRENPKTAVMMAGLAGYIAAEKLLH